MRAVIVTGSRKHTGVDLIRKTLLNAYPDLVIHGGATGADDIARVWCAAAGVNQVQMPAPWDKHGRSAGPFRNTQMLAVLRALQECDWECSVLAFPLSDSIGTRHMMHIAKNAGFDVREVTP